MSRRRIKITASIGAIILLTLLMNGCGATKPTAAKNNLTPNQAAELVYQDLTYHGVRVVKVDITNMAFKDSNTALLDASFLTADGRNIQEKITLIKENEKWSILDHDH